MYQTTYQIQIIAILVVYHQQSPKISNSLGSLNGLEVAQQHADWCPCWECMTRFSKSFLIVIIQGGIHHIVAKLSAYSFGFAENKWSVQTSESSPQLAGETILMKSGKLVYSVCVGCSGFDRCVSGLMWEVLSMFFFSSRDTKQKFVVILIVL